MRAGAVILLFVVYQLWGTGLATSAAQSRLSNEFSSQLTATPTTTTAPASAPAPATAPADLPLPDPGGPLGRLTIPAIDSDFIFVQGVDLKWLKDGPGHFPQTPLPGQAGNAAIAGHRTTYKAPFNRLDELKPGDEITATTLQGTFRYVVEPHVNDKGETSGHFIVSPNEVSILDQTGENRITLMACNPKYSASQRIVVTGRLTSIPVVSTPIPEYADSVTVDASIDTLAGGDPSAWGPALLWGAAAILVWFGVWFLARKGRKWTRMPMWLTYLIGTPLVLVLLFFTYENVARLLPASY